MKTKAIIIWVIVLGLIGWGVYGIVQNSKKPGRYDELATCIKDSGATFYGAFWCPHCQNQKAMFGLKSAKLLPYVECSEKDGKSQKQVCIDANIQSYPTWEFANGTRQTGEIPLAELAEKTSCTLPDVVNTQ
jgi:thiol-disulfide isomerase/thioredoxin